MKKFILFRTDRLGDFIITTRIIKSICDKFSNSHITVLCSPLNEEFVRKYKIINKVIVYDKKFSLLKKFKVFYYIVSKKYHASLAFDGKSFSNLCNFFLYAKYKLGLVYKYKVFGISLFKPNFIYNYFVFNKFKIFTSKQFLHKIEHLPSKYISLSNNLGLNLKISDKYYYAERPVYKKKFDFIFIKKIKKKYILIHFDEKWADIQNINDQLFENIILLQSRIKYKVVLTSYYNNFIYCRNLKKNISNKNNKNICLMENVNLELMEQIIKNSIFSISCHSGFITQIAGANSANLIDIINKKDLRWYSCWKPKNTRHKFLFKSIANSKLPIKLLFKNIGNVIKNF